MKKRSSKLFRILLVSLFCLAMGNFPLLSPNASALELSKHGQEALAQIAECINRDDKDTLNVLYLIDDSKSLRYNDMDDVRADALISSLSQFVTVSQQRPYFEVNREFATFSNNFLVRKKWESVNENSFDSDRDWIIKNVPELDSGTATDWELALRKSQSEFAKVASKSSCEILVWFTDGGLTVPGGQDRDVRTALANICGFDPISLRKTQTSIIDEIRQQNIWIQGILLRNEEAQKLSNGTEAEKKAERSMMSYFSAVVEQSDEIDPYLFEPSSTLFNCGENKGAYGLVQTVTDPVDIIWPTQQFNCMSTGGRVVQVKSGKFEIDPGITRFSITSLSNNFELSGPGKKLIANQKGAVKANVKAEYLNNSNSVIQVSGEVSDSADSAVSPGTWSLKSPDNEKAIVCAFVDLDLQVSASTCYAGEECQFVGSFTRRGLAADLEQFASKKLQAGQLGESRTQLPVVKLNGNSFEGKFTSKVDEKSTYLGVLLTLKTKSGIEFNISTKKPIQIIPPGIYPSVTPDPVKASDFTGPLEGKNGEIKAILNLQGPSRTEGQVCLGPIQVRSDSDPKRIESFVTSIDGSKVTSEKCFSLQAGEEKQVQLSLTNSIPANGTSKGFMAANFIAPNQPEINSKIDVQFESKIIYDTGKRLWIFLVLMLLGIGIPLVGLYLINAANSKILLNNLYIATIPVLTNASGGVVSVRRLENGATASVISQEDFAPFSSGVKKQKKVQIGSEVLEGIAPKSPFGSLKSVLTTLTGSVVVSSSVESTKGLGNNQTPGSLNPAGLMYLVQTEDSMMRLRQENQGNSETNSPIEGRLVALLSFDGDPFEQVNKLDSDIKFNAGWLNKLLEVELKQSTPAEKTQKKSKEKKTKNSSAEEVAPIAAQTENDGWGESINSSGTSGTSTADDWGNSSSQSKDDDW